LHGNLADFDETMPSSECIVCAWRGTCALKFKYESSELHCKEFTKDVALDEKIRSERKDAQEGGSGKPEE